MKIAVLGATGGTGVQVVRQALDLGHSVVALARTPSKLAPNRELQVVKGDAFDSSAVKEVVDGADAVLSCLGRRPFRDEWVVVEGTRNILSAMKKHGVRRLVVESAYCAGNSRPLGTWPVRFVTGVLLHWAYKEKEIMEPEVMASGLDWVIVRPPALRDGSRLGHYRVGEDLRLGVRNWINRADVADFMLKQIASDAWLRKTPAISM